IMMALIFLVMWLFMVRPQKKQQKELDDFRKALKKGDKVVTLGGIHGSVAEISEKTILLEVDNNVKIRVDKASIVKDFADALK
ncbi:MAG: preprotein translocase subunit YajC, partial [Bacteroidales bacterium]|nr:preprotein translocase subunit YajC [Bacteroidales bacterium]